MPFVSTATVSNSKTVTTSISPQLTNTLLTALLALPIGQLCVSQVGQLTDALKRVVGGGTPSSIVGALLP